MQIGARHMSEYDCSCDSDEPLFYVVTKPRARKRHVCKECRGPILPGERYERISAMWESFPQTICTCERCYDLRVWVKNNVPCLCIMHGNMDDEMRNAVQDAYDRARKEVIGLWTGFQRRMIARDRYNKQAREADRG